MKLDALRPVIVVTGFGSVELARKTLTRGVFDFIEKSPDTATELTEAVQRAIATQEEKIRRSGNPFILMTGGEPTIFGGRTKELRSFEEKLNRTLHTKFREHFLILGDWGIGKSTLLREYKKICQSRPGVGQHQVILRQEEVHALEEARDADLLVDGGLPASVEHPGGGLDLARPAGARRKGLAQLGDEVAQLHAVEVRQPLLPAALHRSGVRVLTRKVRWAPAA